MTFETILGLIGLAGAACPVAMYYLLEQEKIDPKSMMYFSVNGIGSVLIIIASAGSFDWGDIGAVLMETAWLVISFMGMYKAIKARKEAGK